MRLSRSSVRLCALLVLAAVAAPTRARADASDPSARAHAVQQIEAEVQRARELYEKPPGSVRVNLKSASSSEHWSLLASDGSVVCDLPCSRWIGPASGMTVQLDAASKEDIQKVPVPADLGYTPGRTVDGTPRAPRGSPIGAEALLIVGGSVAFLGVLVFVATGLPSGTDPTPAQNDQRMKTGITVGFEGISIPGLAILAVGIGLAVYTEARPSLDFTLGSGSTASRGPSLLVRPDFLGLALPSGERFGITGTGVGGAF